MPHTSLDSYFISNAGKLYRNLYRQFPRNRFYREVIDYYGAYEILLKAKETIAAKAGRGQITDISNMEALLMVTAKNIVRNCSRLLEFRQYTSLSASIPFPENMHKVHEEYWDNGHTDPIHLDTVPENLERLLGKMFSELKSGELDKSVQHAKYFVKQMSGGKYSRDTGLYMGMLEKYRADFFFVQGKLGLAHKHAQEAVNLLSQQTDRFGFGPVCSAKNTLGILEINRGDPKKGMETLRTNLSMLDDGSVRNSSPKIADVTEQCEMYICSFLGSVGDMRPRELVDRLLSHDPEGRNGPMDKYVLAYAYMDMGRPEKAVVLLGEKGGGEGLDAVRFGTALSESLLLDFKNTNSTDMQTAYAQVRRNGVLNDTIGNRYFSAMQKIMEGYIISDENLMKTGLGELKHHGFVHFHRWYREKIFGKR